MRIERIEIFVTDLTTRLQRQRSTGPYDTGTPGALIGKPVLVKVFAEGVVGYGQIRPLAPSGRKAISTSNRMPAGVWLVIQVMKRWASRA